MEQRMTPAGPPEPPAAQTEEWTAPTSRGGGWIVLAVLIVAGVALAAYFIGRSAANAPGAYDRGFAQGRRAMALEFVPGTARYGAIYNTGFQAGYPSGLKTGERAGAEKGAKVGLEHGTAIGRLRGQRTGIASGAGAALGGFTRWQPGNYYVVKLARGEQGVPYRIDVRKLMATNQRYAICANDPADVCTKPIKR